MWLIHSRDRSDNINLNLMLANEDYQYPSQLPDSFADQSADNPSIKAVNLYQLDASASDSQEEQQLRLQKPQELQIIHSLDQSSIEHDDFLQMVKQEERGATGSTYPTMSTLRSSNALLLVDRREVSLTLIETQKAREVITFTNPTANPIRVRFSDCSFQIQNDKMLGFVLGQQLQVVIEPWDRVELTFAIEPQGQNYGDLIETVVVMGEFIGREDQISPVSIRFHVHYVSPKLILKYEGNSEVASILQGKLAIVNVKANKLGEYPIEIGLEGISKVQLQIEPRGKVTASTESITIYSGEITRIKLRQRGNRNLKNKERSGLILKPLNSQICYVIGLNFLP